MLMPVLVCLLYIAGEGSVCKHMIYVTLCA